jgi:hypothetical protein
VARKFLNGIDVANQKVVNLASPSSATDAATKSYVDSLVNGLSWHPAVDAATTANVGLSTALASGQTIDGVTLSTGQRVLVKNQSTASQNGIYVVPSTGAASLATDSVTGELTEQSTVRVESGSVNAGTQWTLSTANPITVGTTSQTWVSTSPLSYSAGNGLALSGTTFAVNNGAGIIADGSSTRIDASVVTTKYATTIGDGSSTSITVTHNLGTRDVVVAVYDASTYVEYEVDVTHATTSTVTLVFATAPASSSLRAVIHG